MTPFKIGPFNCVRVRMITWVETEVKSPISWLLESILYFKFCFKCLFFRSSSFIFPVFSCLDPVILSSMEFLPPVLCFSNFSVELWARLTCLTKDLILPLFLLKCFLYAEQGFLTWGLWIPGGVCKIVGALCFLGGEYIELANFSKGLTLPKRCKNLCSTMYSHSRVFLFASRSSHNWEDLWHTSSWEKRRWYDKSIGAVGCFGSCRERLECLGQVRTLVSTVKSERVGLNYRFRHKWCIYILLLR